MTEAIEPASERPARHRPGGASADEDARDVRAARRGDREAFERLVRRHQQAVVDTATYTLGDAEDALEVAQEAFLKAYRALDSFRGEARFRTWILRITVNTCRSLHIRRSAKKRSAPGGGELRVGPAPDAESGGVDIPDSSQDPAVVLERKELCAALETAIAELEPEARSVIVLRDIVGEPYDAIARSVGVPVGTVKSKVHRARLQLRERIAPFL